MNFRKFLETDINKNTEDGMTSWTTPDDLGQLDFIVRGDTLHVDFMRNQDEFDGTKGPAGNLLALIRELKKLLATSPNIKKITANVQNPTVGRWLEKNYGAVPIKRGYPVTVYEIPLDNLTREGK